MKIYKFLLAILIVLPFLQSCQGDIADTGDIRDNIAKKWRVTDNSGTVGAAGYDVFITKDAVESTQVLLDNFHNLGTTDKLKATFDGSTLTIVANQKLDGTTKIIGSGTLSTDLKKITFKYKVDEGDGLGSEITANFGEVITVKKKAAPATLPL